MTPTAIEDELKPLIESIKASLAAKTESDLEEPGNLPLSHVENIYYGTYIGVFIPTVKYLLLIDV